MRAGALPALLLAAACAAPRPAAGPPRADFDCGGVRVSVAFPPDTAVVALRGDTLRLPIAVSASGARYSDGARTFWEHQGTARLELPDTALTDCRRVGG